MKTNLIARAEIEINSTVEKVWDALTNPEKIKEYFFGTYVVTDWKVDSQVLWQGEWNGKSYEDKGKVLKFEENKVIAYSHFSPLTGYYFFIFHFSFPFLRSQQFSFFASSGF